MGAPQLTTNRAISSALRVRIWRYDAPEGFSREAAHETFELSWIDRGAVAMSIGSRTHEIAIGGAMLVPAGVEHRTIFSVPMGGGSVHLGASLFEALEANAAMLRTRLTPGIVEGDRAARIARLLAEEAAHDDASAILAADALADALVIAIARGAVSERGGGHDPRIRRAIELVRARYAETISIDDLAAAAGMSRFHFSRAFRSATGASPYQYVIDARLEAAAAMLRRGHASVSEAALGAGFTDLPRFARAFRKKYGQAPSSHRAACAPEARVKASTP